MGTRKDDPGCGLLGEFANSDVEKGYPQFIRVNPIIEWNYRYVWDVIRALELPYCSLYDSGYTSLGNQKNTNKNESLKNNITNEYLPAYHALDNDERINRIHS
jgi:FAD synthetase